MEHLFGSLEPFVHAYGAFAVAAVLFLESLGAPLPGESLLVFAGLLAAKGELSLPALLAGAFVGAVMGDNAGYLIGRAVGRRVVLRYGVRVGLTEARYLKVEAAFDRFGPAAVAFARFFNVLRQLNGIVAGTASMAWPRFLACNALGAALWVGVWGLGAYFFGDKVEASLKHLGRLVRDPSAGIAIAVGVAALVAAAAAWLVFRRRPVTR